MPNNPSARISATVADQSTPPIPASYGPTISAASAALSLVAIVFAISGHTRAGRLEKESWFEKNFGENLRLTLRKLDKSADALNAFVYKNARSLTAVQDELSAAIITIEDASSDIRGVLREIDLSKRVRNVDWEQTFDAGYREVETLLSGAQDQTNGVLLSRVVLKAKDRIHRLVENLRTKIAAARIY